MNFEKESHKNKGPEGGLKNFLQKTFGFNDKNVEKIVFYKVSELPSYYSEQLKNFDQDILETDIAVIPDNAWRKENQPTESLAENNLIIIKENYFNDKENQDEIGWITHELAHCEEFAESEDAKEYETKRKTQAFTDVDTEGTYPNNLVEKHAFSKQFRYLKSIGKEKQDVWEMLKQYYGKEDFPFFEKLLNRIFD